MFCTFFIWSNTLIVRLAKVVPPRPISPILRSFGRRPAGTLRNADKAFSRAFQSVQSVGRFEP